MVYYVVRCSQANDHNLTGRPSAKEAIQVLQVSKDQGWVLDEITRDKRVIDEATLMRDADEEVPFAFHVRS